MQTRYANSGFTIIEVLIVVAVFGILIAFAAPPMTQFLEDMQASQNTNDLMASLLLARSEAVTRNSSVTMCMIDSSSPNTCDTSNGWEDGWITFEDIDADGIRDAGEEIVDTHTGMEDTSVVTTVNFNDFLSYRPSGAVSSPGAFSICVGGNAAQRVFINATGRPRIAEAVCP